MQAKDGRKIVLITFLIVVVNLVLACAGVAIYALYYSPGNPIPPSRIDIDVIGFLAAFIGISQALYLVPLLIHAGRSRKLNLVKGAASGGIITALLNVILLMIFLRE